MHWQDSALSFLIDGFRESQRLPPHLIDIEHEICIDIVLLDSLSDRVSCSSEAWVRPFLSNHMGSDTPHDIGLVSQRQIYLYIYIVKTKTIFRKYLYATKVLNNFLLYFLQLFANQMLWETWSTNGSSTSLGTCMAVPKDSSWCPGHLNLHWSSHLWLCCCAPLLRQLLVPSQCCSSWQCDARWQPAAERN